MKKVLLVSEEHQLPMITLSIAFDAGSRRDPQVAGFADPDAGRSQRGRYRPGRAEALGADPRASNRASFF